MFFAFLCLIQHIRHNDDGPIYQMPSFGFMKGGTYSFEFKKTTEKELFIAFLNSKEEDRIVNLNTIPYISPCQKPKKEVSAINLTFEYTNTSQTAYGIINSKDVYTPIIACCKCSSFSFEAKTEFLNEKSQLDTRQELGFIMLPINIVLAVVILVFAIINQVIYRQGISKRNILFDIAFIFLVIYLVLAFVALYVDKKGGNIKKAQLISSIPEFICISILFVLIFFISNGWTVVNVKISLMMVIEIFSFEVIFGVIFFFHIFDKSWNCSLVTFICFLVLIIFFWWRMITVTRDVTQVIRAHLLVIAQARIDPSSTPVYSKFKSFTVFANNLLIFLAIWIVILSLELVDLLAFWSLDFAKATLITVELGIITFLFRVRYFNCSGYTTIDDAKTIPKGEIPEDNDQLLAEGEELITWQIGMLLPPEPVVVEEKDIENDLVPV